MTLPDRNGDIDSGRECLNNIDTDHNERSILFSNLRQLSFVGRAEAVFY